MPPEVDVILSAAHGYSSIDDLVTAANVIVQGTYKDASPGRWFAGVYQGGSAVRDDRITVNRVIKGSLDTPTVLVTQSGAEIGGTKYLTGQLMELKSGQEVLLFLIPANEKMERPDGLKRFAVAGLWAGCFAFDGDKVRTSSQTMAPLREQAAKGREAVLDAVTASLAAKKP